MITEERDSLLSETQQMRLIVNEAEVSKENCDRKASALYITNHKLKSLRTNLFSVAFYNAVNTCQSYNR